jgi:hypothetical protein
MAMGFKLVNERLLHAAKSSETPPMSQQIKPM